MKLSIVVPIYNKEKILEVALLKIFSVLSAAMPDNSYEVIAVNDGSTDNSAKILQKFKHPNLKKIFLGVNQGKGNALRTGMRKAKGEYIGYIDCGLDIDAISLWYGISATVVMPDAIIASRFVDGSNYSTNILRTLYSKGFIFIRKCLFSIPTSDSQAAMHLYRKEVIKSLLPYLTENRWLLELEILQYLKIFGYKNIKEVPVVINMNNTLDRSGSANVRNVLRMFGNMLVLSTKIGRLNFNYSRKILLTAKDLNYKYLAK